MKRRKTPFLKKSVCKLMIYKDFYVTLNEQKELSRKERNAMTIKPKDKNDRYGLQTVTLRNVPYPIAALLEELSSPAFNQDFDFWSEEPDDAQTSAVAAGLISIWVGKERHRYGCSDEEIHESLKEHLGIEIKQSGSDMSLHSAYNFSDTKQVARWKQRDEETKAAIEEAQRNRSPEP